MKGKKLPTIWALLTPRVVESDGYRLGETYVTRDDARKLRKTWETIVRYTPAKPVKVCVWTDDGSEEWAWHPGCSPNNLQRDAETFCPACGGRIKVKR